MHLVSDQNIANLNILGHKLNLRNTAIGKITNLNNDLNFTQILFPTQSYQMKFETKTEMYIAVLSFLE